MSTENLNTNLEVPKLAKACDVWSKKSRGGGKGAGNGGEMCLPKKKKALQKIEEEFKKSCLFTS